MKNYKLVVLIIGYLILIGVLTSIIAFFRNPDQFFFNLSAAIMLSWIITLIIFYIWAIYYFHIHLAVEDGEQENAAQEDDKTVAVGDKLLKNPHLGETLGLPKGTIRGTIALSLLIAGLALLIASFEMNQTYNANSLFIDNFEFIKTAFLMVIAFYFGHKSLDAISNRNQGVYRSGKPSTTNINSSSGDTDSFDNQRIAATDATEGPVIPNNGQATNLKKVLKSDGSNVETTDTGTGKSFDDKEAVG